MPLHFLTNFEITKCYQNEAKFNDAYWRNNLSKMKDVTYIINLDEYESIETNWIALYMNAKNLIYFDSFGVEHVLKRIKKLIGNKNIIANIHRIQVYDLIMCGYFCIGLIDFILKCKSLLEYTNLSSPNKYIKKNDKIILKYFQYILIKLKCIVMFAINIEN